ncbi:hypothetical protein ATANTOWER_015376 [Ataeniobius toweri]|uniref:Uncharacterized protein n=1 Tax=Ataeniobius toweri TaxID=208326 RepID=A0ABU7AY01_9TELE|nr:hypothetical protein [Ataeniobius toweri]
MLKKLVVHSCIQSGRMVLTFVSGSGVAQHKENNSCSPCHGYICLWWHLKQSTFEVGLLVKTYSTQLHKDQHAVTVYPPNRRSLTILWPLPTNCPLPKQTPPGPVNT